VVTGAVVDPGSDGTPSGSSEGQSTDGGSLGIESPFQSSPVPTVLFFVPILVVVVVLGFAAVSVFVVRRYFTNQ